MKKDPSYILDKINNYLKSGKCTNKKMYRLLSNVRRGDIVFGSQPYVGIINFSGTGRIVGERVDSNYSYTLNTRVQTTNNHTVEFDFYESNQTVIHRNNKAPNWVLEKYSKYIRHEQDHVSKMCEYAGKHHLPDGFKVKSCQVLSSKVTYTDEYYAAFCAVYILNKGKKRLIGFLNNELFTFDSDFEYENTNFSAVLNVISYIIFGFIVVGVISGIVLAIIEETENSKGIVDLINSLLAFLKY